MKFLNSVLSFLFVVSAPNFATAFYWGSANAIQQHVVDDSTDLKVPGDNPLEYCTAERSSDILQLEYIDLDPNPPSAGVNVTIKGAGTLSQDIEQDAYVQIQVKFGLVTILKTKADFCEQVKNADLECPIEKGKVFVEKKFEMPADIPNGKWTVLADVYTKNDERITCLTAQVVFKKPEEGL